MWILRAHDSSCSWLLSCLRSLKANKKTLKEITRIKNSKEMYNGDFIDITSDEEVSGVRCAGPMSVASSS